MLAKEILTRAIDKPRNVQLEMTEFLANGLRPGVVAVQASTGVGKTLAVLSVAGQAALNGKPVTVSTQTIQLINQIIGGGAQAVTAAVQEVTGKRISVAVHYGLQNFVSQSRVRSVRARLEAAGKLTDQLRAELDGLAEFSQLDGRVEAWLTEVGSFPAGLDRSDVCLLPTCPAADRAAYERRRTDADTADILVQTHAMTLLRARGGDARPVIIFDEADAVVDVEAGSQHRNLSLGLVGDLIVRLVADGADMSAAREAHAELLRQAREGVLIDTETDIRSAMDALSEALSVHVDDPELRLMLADARTVLRWHVRVRSDSGVVFERRDNDWTIRVLTLSPGFRIWPRLKAAGVETMMLVSATLAPSGDLRKSANQFGVSDEDWLGFRDLAPEKFGRLSFTLAGRRAPKPFDSEKGETSAAWLDYSAGMVSAAMSKPGRTLVLTTSYADAEGLSERIGNDVVILHRPGTRLTEYLQVFRESDDAALMTPSGWAGLDLPGLISDLVITRIPFGRPDELHERLLADVLAERGYDPDAARTILRAHDRMAAIRKMSQGIGRALRREQDTARIWIADPRMPVPPRHWRLGEPRFADFVDCVPPRFRTGARASWSAARIWKGNTSEEKAA